MNEDKPIEIPVPDVESYVKALTALSSSLAESRRELLVAHYEAHGHVSTMTDLANAVGFESFRGANVQYGTLGRLVAEQCGIDPRARLQTLVLFVRPETLANREWLLVLRPEVCRALEQLGWVKPGPNLLYVRPNANEDTE